MITINRLLEIMSGAAGKATGSFFTGRPAFSGSFCRNIPLQ